MKSYLIEFIVRMSINTSEVNSKAFDDLQFAINNNCEGAENFSLNGAWEEFDFTIELQAKNDKFALDDAINDFKTAIKDSFDDYYIEIESEFIGESDNRIL